MLICTAKSVISALTVILFESDKDIISGAYLLASGEVTAYKQMLGKGYIYDEVKEMFNTDPQTIVDAIRKVGYKVYSDRSEKKQAIT